jgi:uncharacterized protein YeeX (DUF496 family)
LDLIEQRGNETILRENYIAAYELWQKRSPDLMTNMEAKLLLNKENYISRNKKVTGIEIDEIKANIRSDMQDNIEDHVREEEISNNIDTSQGHIENKTQE